MQQQKRTQFMGEVGLNKSIDLATKMISRGKAMPRNEKAPLGKSLVA